MRLLIEEALSHEPMVVEKRLSPTGIAFDHYRLKHKEEDYCAVTIIRSGDSMVQEVMDLIPGITIGKMLIQRDEGCRDKHSVFIYNKLPEDISHKQRVFIVDPMLATGGSIVICISKLIEAGVPEERITFINLISCETGLNKLHSQYPKVKVITAAIDPVLNENMYIIPGLGDFGDRYFASHLPS